MFNSILKTFSTISTSLEDSLSSSVRSSLQVVAVVALIVSSVFVSLQLVVPVRAQETTLTNSEISEIETETAIEKSVASGPHFRYAESLSLSEDLTGDVYAAGGSVKVTGTIDGDLMVTGGTVLLSGTVTGDVRGAGGTVVVVGEVTDNLTVAGGTVSLLPGSTVGNSVVATGGVVSMMGEIDGKAIVTAGTTEVEGTIGDDLTVRGEELQVADGATVLGGLFGKLATDPVIAPTASISGGEAIEIKDPAVATSTAKAETVTATETDVALAPLEILTGILEEIGEVLIGTAMALFGAGVVWWLLPGLATDAAERFQGSRLKHLGFGFAYLLLVPIALLLLAATVIGIPLVIVGTGLFLVDIIVAYWIAAYGVGLGLCNWVRSRENSISAYVEAHPWMHHPLALIAKGALVLELISLIPILGGLVKFGFYLMGMGVLTVMLYEWFNQD